jgi:hypothetical protein
MKRLFLLMLMLMVFVGCAGVPLIPSTACKDAPECSLICAAVPNPESQDLLIQIANDELLYQGVYTAAEATTFLKRIEGYIKEMNTYADLISAVEKELGLLPDRIRNKLFILSAYSGQFAVELPICEFDRALLLKGIQNQKSVVGKYQ